VARYDVYFVALLSRTLRRPGVESAYSAGRLLFAFPGRIKRAATPTLVVSPAFVTAAPLPAPGISHLPAATFDRRSNALISRSISKQRSHNRDQTSHTWYIDASLAPGVV
jgi:hypothetical protein